MQRGVWAGEKLKELLRARNMTQEQLGRAAGLRRTDINRYVNNKQRLGERNAARIARALSVTPAELGVTDSGFDGRISVEQMERIEALLVETHERLERIEARMAG